MIAAVGGSRCSSSGSVRSSRDRCTVTPRDRLPPIARDRLRPHDVPPLIPSVTDAEADSPAEWLTSRLADRLKSPKGADHALRLAPRPRLVPEPRLTE